MTYPYTGTANLTPGNVSQRRDYGEVRGTTLIIGGTTTLVGKSYNNYDRTYQYDRVTGLGIDVMIIWRYDAIWDFPTADGGFEGNINMLITDYNPGPPATYHAKFSCLLHGYGAFEGQTLQFTYDGPNGLPWEGYLLKP